MVRARRSSTVSNDSSVGGHGEQELSSMYDYLAKIILLGPSGAGKSCLLHRFIKDDWRTLTSQTIGVEFASKIIKVGTGARRKRIKLQLWDTAGTERFRSVSRSYYRGAAGALLCYDVSSYESFAGLGTFLRDARALASPQLAVVLTGCKSDVSDGGNQGSGSTDDGGSVRSERLVDVDAPIPAATPTSSDSSATRQQQASSSSSGLGSKNTKTVAPDGREVTLEAASQWASSQEISAAVEVSAFTGDGVDDAFARLARNILTRIELGEIDPSDPTAGVQYGDYGDVDDGARPSTGGTEGSGGGIFGKGSWARRRRKGTGGGMAGLGSGMREWEDVFRVDLGGRRRRGCCF